MSFTLWVLLGALGIYITKDLGLSAFQQGLMAAIPTLSGSIFRVFFGLLSDRYGGKSIGTGMLIFLFLPLLLGWLVPGNFPTIIAIGLMLGVGGASFAVALPMASHWYPPTRQGLVMGISAAGNIGTVIANLLAPSLAKTYGWHAVLAMAMLPLAVVLIAFVLLAKDSPARPRNLPASRYLTALRVGDLWWFCLFYSVTFGGFVGLGSFLPIFLHNQYNVNPVSAGLINALAAFMGSTLRPLGGFLADKFGGTRALSILLILIAIFYTLAGLLLPLNLMIWLLVGGVSCLGLGNGAIFQLVPQRFRDQIGLATGIVGAFGGLGGFLLPTLLGSVKQSSGSYAGGIFTLAVIALVALIVLRLLVAFQNGWRISWKASAATTEVA